MAWLFPYHPKRCTKLLPAGDGENYTCLSPLWTQKLGKSHDTFTAAMIVGAIANMIRKMGSARVLAGTEAGERSMLRVLVSSFEFVNTCAWMEQSLLDSKTWRNPTGTAI